MMKINTLSSLLILLVLVTSASTTSAQTTDAKSWSTAGSTGTADKIDLNKIVYSNGIVSFPETQGTQLSPPGRLALPLQTLQAVVRYNVTAADGLFFPSGRLCMVARFKDDGNRARVLLRLVQFNLESGTTTTLLTFDSNSFSPQPNFQANSVATDRIGFDFAHNAYYVEATLTKQHPLNTPLGGGKPALAVVVLTRCVQF
jgi:hypothetical protein